MKLSRGASTIALLSTLTSTATAFTKLIKSDALQPCPGETNTGGFTAERFQVVFTPENRTLNLQIAGTSTITGNLTAHLQLSAYGYPALSKTIDACDTDLTGLCPLTAGKIPLLKSNLGPNDISQDTVNQIPSIAYTVPDLDGLVQVTLYRQGTQEKVGCVEAQLTNGASVYQKPVAWATAVCTILLFLVAGILYEAAGSLSFETTNFAGGLAALMSFFQHQALFGLLGVNLPPIAASWTQNFQWSMGIIHLDFIQDIATWYLRATGGTSSSIIARQDSISVSIEKRSDDFSLSRAAAYGFTQIKNHGPELMKRAYDSDVGTTTSTVTLTGIQRVGFRAGVELTVIFATAYAFYVILMTILIILVGLFKLFVDVLARSGKIQGPRFMNLRERWTIVLKGALTRAGLVGFVPLAALCFYELFAQDSAGLMALAIVTILTFLVTLGFSCWKVIDLSRRSLARYQGPSRNPLYSNPDIFEKWGALYFQYIAKTYWFFIPTLLMILLLGLFVAFGQKSGLAQAVGFLIIELGFLVAVSILRPWTSKTLQIMNIAIAAMNLVSAIFCLFFTDDFGLTGLVAGVMGILFFFANAVAALVLVITVLYLAGKALFVKDQKAAYQPMTNHRDSSRLGLHEELEPLGGDPAGTKEVKNPFADPAPYAGGDLGETKSPYGHGVDTSYRAAPAPFDSNRHSRSQMSLMSTPEADQGLSAGAYKDRHKTGIWQRGAGYQY